MDDLIARIFAAIDEDEQAARYAIQAGGTGVWSEPTSGALCLEGVEGIDGLIPIGDLRLTRHMERHDPARILDKVAADREILALHPISSRRLLVFVEEGKRKDPGVMYEPGDVVEYMCGTCDANRHEECYGPEPACPTILALAKGYGIEP